jgi:hypothetical protein
MKRNAVLPAAVLLAAIAAGCLDSPSVEETWTRIEILSAVPATREGIVGQADVPVEVRARITYREILTGFLVADLRSAPGIAPGDVDLVDDPDDDEDGLDVAREVDAILMSSTSVGVEAIEITGFDHLIQEATLEFDVTVPDTSAAGGLFLLVYFSSDVEELEDENGNEIDSILVTPTLSTERDILSAGDAIEAAPPGN